MQETKSLIFKERLKEKLGKQDFHCNMKEIFEPVGTLSEKQKQALHDSTRAASQTTSQASKIRQKQYENRALFYKNQLKEYMNMMKLLIVIISFLQVLFIPTKLILVL